jgi:hypothetical protein
MSASRLASVARIDPSRIDITRKYPRPISTTVWRTSSPSKMLAAPLVMLTRPEVTAANWSALSRGSRSETATNNPSDDTTTACATPGTRSVKALISQLRSLACWLRVTQGSFSDLLLPRR